MIALLLMVGELPFVSTIMLLIVGDLLFVSTIIHKTVLVYSISTFMQLGYSHVRVTLCERH